MPTSNTPDRGRPLLPRFMRRLALVAGIVTVVGWADGGSPNRAPLANGASLRNTLGSVPSDAPPGATVAVYAVYFDSFAAGISVLIEFDDARTILATKDLVTCDNNRGAGFGTECNGQVIEVTIPPNATPGAHRLVLETNTAGNNIQIATAPFTVDMAPSPTNTPTVTATSTATATETTTSTSTATNTATGTASPTATPSQTSTKAPFTSTPYDALKQQPKRPSQSYLHELLDHSVWLDAFGAVGQLCWPKSTSVPEGPVLRNGCKGRRPGYGVVWADAAVR